jgi:hypothetical protein
MPLPSGVALLAEWAVTPASAPSAGPDPSLGCFLIGADSSWALFSLSALS